MKYKIINKQGMKYKIINKNVTKEEVEEFWNGVAELVNINRLEHKGKLETSLIYRYINDHDPFYDNANIIARVVDGTYLCISNSGKPFTITPQYLQDVEELLKEEKKDSQMLLIQTYFEHKMKILKRRVDSCTTVLEAKKLEKEINLILSINGLSGVIFTGFKHEDTEEPGLKYGVNIDTHLLKMTREELITNEFYKIFTKSFLTED